MELSPKGSGSTEIFLTRRILFNKIKHSGHVQLADQISSMKKFVEKRTKCPDQHLSNLHKKISFFVSDFKKRWANSNRKEERFLINNETWLDTSIGFPNYSVSSTKKVGRPLTSFKESSQRAKRQKTESLRTKHSHEELSFAAQMSLRSAGQVDASKVVKEVTTTTPLRGTKYRTAYKKFNIPQIRKLTGREALAMCVEAKLTRYQYNVIRNCCKSRFPSYKIIQLAKKECYPQKESIVVTDTIAEIKLQSLLDHTATRLLEGYKEVLEIQKPEDIKNMNLICKWGMDGSAQSEYKQTFSSDPNAKDANIFISSLVPIRLISNTPEEQQPIVIWQNERPSSTRYCRPIKFIFEHETPHLAKTEAQLIREQIEELRPVTHFINDNEIKVNFIMLFTMVDGKICNAITETTSTQRCYLCGLTSKDFNNIEKVCNAQIIDTSRLEFGLSVLHAWIRFFECCLHLSYKLPLKKWQARGDQAKRIVADTKRLIQDKFKVEMGLHVDKPKSGFGNSNDGNTSRRAFSDPETTSRITGVDMKIIERFKIILQTISSGHEINVDKFRSYCLQTAELFVEKCEWYPMPPTIHKILIHGREIIELAVVPIGQLSEEAQEARNKEFKKYREGYSRKISRAKTNEDILNLLLISSDPLITSMRKVPKKKSGKFEKDVLELLMPPNVHLTTNVSMESEKSDNEYDNSSDSE